VDDAHTGPGNPRDIGLIQLHHMGRDQVPVEHALRRRVLYRRGVEMLGNKGRFRGRLSQVHGNRRPQS
jgi:hypothetical protein